MSYIQNNLLTFNFWNLFNKKIVFLDFETTGINFDLDHIIEIGMFEIVNEKPSNEYSTLINPQVPIPQLITNITGISQEMILNAPLIYTQMQKFCDYVNDAIIIAHNANFEKNFIKKFFNNAAPFDFIDSCELAILIMPHLKYYNLENLLNFFNIKDSEEHRALVDAYDTFYVLNNIISYAYTNYDKTYFKELYEKSKQCFNQANVEFFRILYTQFLKVNIDENKAKNLFLVNKNDNVELLVSNQLEFKFAPEPLFNNLISEIIKLDEFKTFSNNNLCLELISYLIETFKKENYGLVLEVPYKINKIDCLIYSCALFSKRTNEKITIIESQNNLIDIIFEKYKPVIKNVFNNEVNFNILNDPEDYICKLNYQIFNEYLLSESTIEEKILEFYTYCYLKTSNKGNLKNFAQFLLTKYPKLNIFIESFKYSPETCLNENCSKFNECYLKNEINKIKNSDLLITSISNYIKWKKYFPNLFKVPSNLIIDQVHKLEDTMLNTLSVNINFNELLYVFSYLNDLQQMLNSTDFINFSNNNFRLLSFYTINQLQEILNYINTVIDNNCNKSFVIMINNPNYSYFKDIFIEMIVNFSIKLKEINIFLNNIIQNILNSYNKNFKLVPNNYKKIYIFSNGLLKHLTTFDKYLERLMYSLTNKNKIYNVFLKIKNIKKDWYIYIEPSNIEEILSKNVLNLAKNFILISSALTVNNTYDFIKLQLGLNKYQIEYKSLVQNFNIDLLIPRELPPFNSNSKDDINLFLGSLSEFTIKIASKVKSKIMIIINSIERMNILYKNISEKLIKLNIPFFYQKNKNVDKKIVKFLKNNEHCVILGSSLLMDFPDLYDETVDILILEKLPFPFIENQYNQSNFNNNFNEFKENILPSTILRIKQILGRIINENNEGLLIIADSKLINANYLETIKSSLSLNNIYFTFEEYWREKN